MCRQEGPRVDRERPRLLQEPQALEEILPIAVVQLAQIECRGQLLGKRIGVLGAAFKPLSDDVRDSPALNVAAQLQLKGAHVTIYDPEANESARALFPTLGYAESTKEAVEGAHLVLHLTEWQEFRDLDPSEISDIVREKRILDGRNALEPDRWRSAGWTYRALGRP